MPEVWAGIPLKVKTGGVKTRPAALVRIKAQSPSKVKLTTAVIAGQQKETDTGYDPFQYGYVTRAERGISGPIHPELIASLTSSKKTTTSTRPGFGILPRYRNFSWRQGERAIALAEVYDRICDSEMTVFFTGTSPGRSRRAREAYAKWSGRVKKNFINWCRKLNGGATEYMFRWERHKDGMLHWHAVVCFSTREIAQEAIDRFWLWSLKTIGKVSEWSGVDAGERGDYRPRRKSLRHCYQAEAEFVRKGAARYVAKYVGKLARVGTDKRASSPACWLSCSRKLSRELHRIQAQVTAFCASQIHANWLGKLIGVCLSGVCDRYRGLPHTAKQYSYQSCCSNAPGWREQALSIASQICSASIIQECVGVDSDVGSYQIPAHLLGGVVLSLRRGGLRQLSFRLEPGGPPDPKLIERVREFCASEELGGTSSLTLLINCHGIKQVVFRTEV